MTSPFQVITDPSHCNCPFPFAIDTYDETCPFGCVYCYAAGVDFGKFGTEQIRRIEALFLESFGGRQDSLWHRTLRMKVPLRIGYLRDPLPAAELREGRTARLLQLLNRYEYPYTFVTKSDLVGHAPYAALLSAPHAAVHVSITTLNEDLAKQLEPRAPSPLARLKAMRLLVEAGACTVARVNPLIGSVKRDGEQQGYFSFQLLDEIQAVGVRQVVFGLLNPGGGKTSALTRILGDKVREAENSLLREALQYSRGVGLSAMSCHLGPAAWKENGGQMSGGEPCCMLRDGVPSADVAYPDRLRLAGLGAFERLSLRGYRFLIRKLHE